MRIPFDSSLVDGLGRGRDAELQGVWVRWPEFPPRSGFSHELVQSVYYRGIERGGVHQLDAKGIAGPWTC